MTTEEPRSIAATVALADLSKLEVVTKRIPIKTSTLWKVTKISSLFLDEIGPDAKEIDIIAFFFEKSFESFLKSGIIEEKIKDLTE